MNKKLMAVAVAGALAVPALAFAQASTVQIYGKLNTEYGIANQPDFVSGQSRVNADAFNSGASNIGFKGEEKLSGGLSATFQCESSTSFMGGTGAFCDRNSAVGVKGGFGSLYIGTWDTPLKKASGVTRMTAETGWLGTQQLLLSGSNLTDSFDFSRRTANSINYDTPNMSGFTASVAFTSLNTSTNTTSSDATAKKRTYGLNAMYANGPLAVVAGYEKQENNISSATTSNDDSAWLVGATYTFGPLKAGLTYVDAKKAVLATTEAKRTSWNLALQYQLGGPGSILAGYARAGDYKGNSTDSVANTGANMWQISYNHALSKRTNTGLGYGILRNDSAGTYSLTGLTSGAANKTGENASVFTVYMNHSF